MGASSSILLTQNTNANGNNATVHSSVKYFVDERVSEAAKKIVEKENRHKNSFKISVNSLRSLALRHHSRRQNSYIHQDIVTASFAEYKSNVGLAGSHSSNNISTKSSHQNLVNEPINSIPQQQKGNSIKNKFNLKLQINDEDDWIQVSDEEGGDEEISPRTKKMALNNCTPATQSYILTQSGTLFVTGFGEGIGKNGIVDSTHHVKFPMRERFVVLCKLGQGACSIVYKALDITDMRLVALKMVSVWERDKRRQMVRELSALFQLLRKKKMVGAEVTSADVDLIETVRDLFAAQHLLRSGEGSTDSTEPVQASSDSPAACVPEILTNDAIVLPQQYIVDFYDAFSNVEEGGVALMMEYMDGGSLQDIVASGGCQDESVLASVAVQGLIGLACLHGCHQIHRDIKPANVLVDISGHVKIADLGIIRQFDVSPPNVDNAGDVSENVDINNTYNEGDMHKANTFVGTTTYMAPERIDGQEYSYSSDVWSFGLSLLAVAIGFNPIDSKNGFWSVLSNVRDHPPPVVPNNGTWSEEFQDFISKFLKHDPKQRWSSVELLQHDFLRKTKIEDIDLIDNCRGHVGLSGIDIAQSETVLASVQSEVEAIVDALFAHVTILSKNESKNKSANMSTETIIASAALLGARSSDVSESTISTPKLSVEDMVKLLLFGDESTATSTSNGKTFLTEKSTNNQVKKKDMSVEGRLDEERGGGKVKPHRLLLLARQLHISVEQLKTLVKHAVMNRKYKDSIDNKATPKAFHSQR